MIVSVLLHDCAMHITPDGFYSLIKDKLPKTNSRYIDTEVSWSELWHDFFTEAKRFDSKKLNSLFGDSKPVRVIPENKIDLTERDKLLIGEFVRRHHARMAHEIAFYGVPGVDGHTIELGEEPCRHFLDLCGFIARSHHLGLRQAVDKLEKDTRRVHLNCHVPFIMLLLRISDYIQIHSERAPGKLLKLKTLVSPISIGEWKKHNSIVDIHQEHDDPEAMYVDAEPEDAITYEELKKLFSGIQSELDLSWSVLGEVYGKSEGLKNFAIKIRRIRSSLDSYNNFIKNKKPDYIPKVLQFKTADSEMMELLIEPLYGDNPEVGIRELVQNSIDAYSELKDCSNKSVFQFETEREFDVCVTLLSQGDEHKVIIEDYGIGMTLDVVENYFLNIGASFRKSDLWKREHETDGHSDVYRTGRFGIGLLAAYLLGDELEVVTRHKSQSKGFAFKCKKGDSKIVVTNTDFHIGTRITINISEDIYEYLKFHTVDWDWFTLSTIKVLRKIVDYEGTKLLQQEFNFPGSKEDIEDTPWFRINYEGYDDILWSYESFYKSRYRFNHRGLICNGIKITNSFRIAKLEVSARLGFLVMSEPNLSVFDQDGLLPINLERNSLLVRRLPFHEELSKSVSDYLSKELIKFSKNIGSIGVDLDVVLKLYDMSIEGLHVRSPHPLDVCPFLIRDAKLIPLDFELIYKSKINELYIDAINIKANSGAFKSREFVKHCDSYLAVDGINSSKKSRTNFIRSFFELNSEHSIGGLKSLPVRGGRLLIKASDVEDVVTNGNVPKTFWRVLRQEWSNDKWLLMSHGYTPKLELDLDRVCNDLDESKSFGFICCYLDWDGVKSEPSIFSQSFLAINNKPYINGSKNSA